LGARTSDAEQIAGFELELDSLDDALEAATVHPDGEPRNDRGAADLVGLRSRVRTAGEPRLADAQRRRRWSSKAPL